MSTLPIAQPHHLRRKAVIYIRQSTGHQVLTNTESQQLQHAMREHARHLGWPDDRIEVVETDMGRTAQSTERRDGYKALLAEVALGQVGIVLSYESTRLSRNCTDWYPLLDLCAYNQCLIADRDGVYDAATPNGRLLLGMKGIVSEIELHTLRGRLIAGVQQKAQRGDLALALPAGLLRQDDGGGDRDLTESGLCRHLCVWQNAEPSATGRWASPAASPALKPVEGDRARPLPGLHYLGDV